MKDNMVEEKKAENCIAAETVRETRSEAETFLLARELGEKAGPGEVYLLRGDLGVGKTVFARGFAAGLGITEPVTSPTFTILKEYPEGRIPLYHFDVYRVGDPDEMEETGYFEYLEGDGVLLIEWPEMIEEILPESCTSVTIEKDTEKGFDYRRISIRNS